MGAHLDVAAGVDYCAPLWSLYRMEPDFDWAGAYVPPRCVRERRGGPDPPAWLLDSIPEDDVVYAGSTSSGGSADGTGGVAGGGSGVGGGGGLDGTVSLAHAVAADGRAVGSSVSQVHSYDSGAPQHVIASPSGAAAAAVTSSRRASRSRDAKRASRERGTAARRADCQSRRAVDAADAFVVARMAGDGGDACDVLWGGGDSDFASDEDRLTRSRPARLGAPPLPRPRSATPPPYTREELDQLYAAGHTRYDDDDADLTDDDDLTDDEDLDDGFAAALAALA